MNRFRKIAFVGTACTGKTTLFTHFKIQYQHDPHYFFLDEEARKYFLAHPEIERFTSAVQQKIQDAVVSAEQLAYQSGARYIISDRSALDALMYVRLHNERNTSERMYEQIRHLIPTYHTIFLLDPADVPYVTDSIRQEDISERNKLHQHFLDFFYEKNIPYQLLSGSPEERIQKVQLILREI